MASAAIETIQANLVTVTYERWHSLQAGPQSDKLFVPIIPKSLRQTVLRQCHDAPNAAHLGPDKTTLKVRQLGYWVGMIHDITLYCRECVTCQSSKPPSPQKSVSQLENHGKWLL